MAPERITGGETGPSVDLYALGVIFFEMATGKLPFEASDPTTFLIKHMKEKPPPPRAIDPRLPEKLDTLIVQLLEKDPKARPVDAHRIEQELVGARERARRPRAARAGGRSAELAPARRGAAARRGASVGEARRGVRADARARRRGSPTPGPGANAGRGEEARARAGGLRESSALEQRKLEDIDARGRDGRTRFGFAVDALGLDASKARGEVRGARASLESLAADSKRSAEAYKEAQREVITWEGRSGQGAVRAARAKAYRAVAETVDGWLAVRTLERAAQAVVEEKDRTVTDLDYQIAELRAGSGQPRAGHRPRSRRHAEAPGRAERWRRARRGPAGAACHELLPAAACPTRARPLLPTARVRGRSVGIRP
jgi:hypothetical protein